MFEPYITKPSKRVTFRKRVKERERERKRERKR